LPWFSIIPIELKNMVDKQINIVSEDVENLKNTVADPLEPF
jgi:hypothetical protein